MKQIPFAKDYYLDEDGNIYPCKRGWKKRKLNPGVDLRAGGYRRMQIVLDDSEKVYVYP